MVSTLALLPCGWWGTATLGAIGPTVLQPPVKNCFVVFRGCSIQL